MPRPRSRQRAWRAAWRTATLLASADDRSGLHHSGAGQLQVGEQRSFSAGPQAQGPDLELGPDPASSSRPDASSLRQVSIDRGSDSLVVFCGKGDKHGPGLTWPAHLVTHTSRRLVRDKVELIHTFRPGSPHLWAGVGCLCRSLSCPELAWLTGNTAIQCQGVGHARSDTRRPHAR